MVVDMRVEGRAKLKRRLERIPDAVRPKVGAAVVKNAEVIAAMQRRLVPKDEGDLERSIAVTGPGQQTPAHSQPGGSRRAGELEAIVTAGNSEARHAALVEYGTKPHLAGGMFEGKQHPGTQPQPYFWIAYRTLRERVRRSIKRAIGKAMKEEFER